jgi:hypothetical protein
VEADCASEIVARGTMLDKFRPGSFLGFVVLWPIIALIM